MALSHMTGLALDGRRPRNAAAWHIQSDLIAMRHEPPPSVVRLVTLGIPGACAALLTWAALFELDIVATADGRMVPQSQVTIAQPAEAGVVKEILVHEGDTVRMGQVLWRLDARASEAELFRARTDLWFKLLSKRRLEAELAGSADLPADTLMVQVHLPGTDRTQRPEPWQRAVAEQVSGQFRARVRAHEDALLQEEGNLRRAQAEWRSARQVKEKLQMTLPTYQQAALAYRQLRDEGFVGALASEERQREAQEREQDLRTQDATLDGIQAAISQARQRLVALRSDRKAALASEGLDLQSQIGRAEQDLAVWLLRLEQLETRAPQTGVIKDLAVHQPGTVVQAGAVLANIVPVNEPLLAEVALRNEDVGSVRTGQKVQLKVGAFPFQRHGLLEGEVIRIGPDASEIRPGTSATPGPSGSYRVMVRPANSADASLRARLQAGMQVTADIHLGRQSALSYLLSPVQRIAKEAGRER